DENSPPMLRLALTPPAPKGLGEQRLMWKVGPGRAELAATARWTNLPVAGLLQWEVPAGIKLEEVRGANLRSWSRSGSRLQVWLDGADQMPNEQGVVLHLTGWLARPVDDVEQEKTPFVLPNLYLPGLAEQTALVGVTPRNGWRLVSQDVHGFLPAPD